MSDNEIADKEEVLSLENVSLKAVFKVVPSKYLHVTGLFIGKVKVASYCIDGMCSKGDKKRYSVTSSLPSIKANIGRFETEQECRDACIRVAKVFCRQILQND